MQRFVKFSNSLILFSSAIIFIKHCLRKLIIILNSILGNSATTSNNTNLSVSFILIFDNFFMSSILISTDILLIFLNA